VCATMSSGKSTFVNALLGKDFIPSKNEACTAKVTTIRDNDKLENLIGCFYNDSGNIVYSNNINSDTLIKWNEDDTVKRIVLEADIEEIECRRSVIVMHDTPGTNNSQDISHYERTMNFLKETNIDIMLYLINAEHISTTDTEILIKQLKSEIVDKGNTKVLFLLNKADSFDIERGEELLEIIKKIEEELVSYGFTKPLITPISSNAARLFKLVLNGSELTKKEVNDFKNLMEYFSDEEIKFSSYSNFSQKIKENKKYVFGDEDNSIKVGKNEYRRNDIIKALQYTGINVVESWLDEQIN
ncbi:dynamin family protein, partial [Clostridium neonatale]|uniref:dynamin family protein n=1 Tax=Clostridium neonatale TaxID=137838 RepID=UPI003D348161